MRRAQARFDGPQLLSLVNDLLSEMSKRGAERIHSRFGPAFISDEIC